MKTWRLTLALACLLSAGACGGDSSSGRGGNDNPDIGTTVNSGARIGWDQPVESPSTARGYTYTVYVDGSPMAINEVTCADVRSAGGVACTGRLPSISRGRHTLELTASVNGFESTRSQPLVVSVNSLAQQSITADSPVSMLTPTSQTAVCPAQENCYQRTLIASGQGVVSFPVLAGTQLFFVEDRTRVRVISGDELQPWPALTLGPNTRITGLAVPSDYERSRAVFVAWSELLPNGGERLNLTRYRELLGTLAEGATIVTGLPVPLDGQAPMAIDDRGRLYVALSSEGGPDARAPSGLSGFILRFDADGTVSQSNPTASPVIANGYSRPVSLSWDPVARQVWVSGTDSNQPNVVSTLAVDPEGRPEWPWVLTGVTISEGHLSSEPPVLALTQGASQVRSLWAITTDGAERTALTKDNRLSLRPAAIVGASAVADGPGDSVFAFTRSETSPTYEVWRLTPTVANP